jgi:DNA-binding HxlR family transcriptional regulator
MEKRVRWRDKPVRALHAFDQRRRTSAISRKLRLLRAHGLIHKLPHTHRYRVTESGRLILNAVLAAHRMTTQRLTAAA